jgi:opacity protein-like surface antigen
MLRHFLAVILGCVLFVSTAEAQDRGRFSARLDAQFVQPVFGLADRFSAFPSGALALGYETDARTHWELRLTFLNFPQSATPALAFDPAERDVDASLIGVGLEVVGGGIHVERRLREAARFLPYVSIGGGFYHWKETRAAYDHGEIFLTPLERSQWSGGLTGGLGLEYVLSPMISLTTAADYNLIFGELWPTLAVGLENVSTFQFVSARLGVRVFI